MTIPTLQFLNCAHKHGVKVIGEIFFSILTKFTSVYGTFLKASETEGMSITIINLLQKFQVHSSLKERKVYI